VDSPHHHLDSTLELGQHQPPHPHLGGLSPPVSAAADSSFAPQGLMLEGRRGKQSDILVHPVVLKVVILKLVLLNPVILKVIVVNPVLLNPVVLKVIIVNPVVLKPIIVNPVILKVVILELVI